MAAEPQTVKATEHEVVAPERAPGTEPRSSEIGAWFGRPPRVSAGAVPPDLPGILASADTATRVRLVGELQRQYGNAHVQRLLAAPTPSAAVAKPRSGMPVAVRLRIISDVEDIAWDAQGRALPMKARQVDLVVNAVKAYVDDGEQAYGRGETDRPSAYVDKFVEACLKRAYDRGVIASDYSNAWDDILENASDEQEAELRGLLGRVASEYATYKATVDPDAASFLYDVADPVFFKATQLLSFGIVDKELFTESSALIKVNDYESLMSFIGLRVGRAAVDMFTLGMGSAYLQGVWDFAEENPDAGESLLGFAGAQQAGIKAALEAFLPLHEYETIHSRVTGTSSKPGELPAGTAEAWEAFFTGMMKVIGIIAAAKGAREYAAKNGIVRAPLKGSVTGDVLHAGGKGRPAEEPTTRTGDEPTARVSRPEMTFQNALALLKTKILAGNWKDIVEGLPAAEADALETARNSFAEKLGVKGARTGRFGPKSDLDITVRTNAEAQRWMDQAVKELFGKDLADITEPAERIQLMERVKVALDVNISTDAGRVTFYDATGLSRGAAVTAEAAGLKAAQTARMRILKGLMDKGNPAARELFENAAREMGVDPATVKALDRLPLGELPTETLNRIKVLKKQLDTLAKLNNKNPTDFSARRLVELHTELLSLDPEAYLYAGGVKAEVILQEPRSSSRKGTAPGRLSAREGQGNIENNHLNAINELSKAKVGANPYEHAGGSKSFSKYVWRVLRTARAFGVDVNADLLNRAQRINTSQGKAITTELATPQAKAEFAQACLAEIARAETAFKARKFAVDRPSGPTKFTSVYESSEDAEDEILLSADEGDLVGSVESQVLETARAAPPSRTQTAAPTPMLGRAFGGEREAAARTGAGGIVVDEQTREYEADVLPAIYLQQRDALKGEILGRIREEGRRGPDVNADGTTPATAWWDCLLNGDADDYFDPQAGTTITPKEVAVDLDGAIVEIDNFLGVDPPFPSFVGLYQAGMSDYLAGRTRVPAGVGHR